jgi:hypothetical protein
MHTGKKKIQNQYHFPKKATTSAPKLSTLAYPIPTPMPIFAVNSAFTVL